MPRVPWAGSPHHGVHGPGAGIARELRAYLEHAARERWGDLWQQRRQGLIITDERYRRQKADDTLERAYYDGLLSLSKAAKVAIVDRRSPHSLRHTHAALRVAIGDSAEHIMADLGHENADMTRRYRH
jgi:integrase